MFHKNLTENLFLKISCLVFSITSFTFIGLKSCADNTHDTGDVYDVYDPEVPTESEKLARENQALKQQLQLYERANGLHVARASELWRVNSLLVRAEAHINNLQAKLNKIEVARRERLRKIKSYRVKLLQARSEFDQVNQILRAKIEELSTENHGLRVTQAERILVSSCDCHKAQTRVAARTVALDFTVRTIGTVVSRIGRESRRQVRFTGE